MRKVEVSELYQTDISVADCSLRYQNPYIFQIGRFRLSAVNSRQWYLLSIVFGKFFTKASEEDFSGKFCQYFQLHYRFDRCSMKQIFPTFSEMEGRHKLPNHIRSLILVLAVFFDIDRHFIAMGYAQSLWTKLHVLKSRRKLIKLQENALCY